MSEPRAQRRLAAILYADVAEYSRLTDKDEEDTHKKLGTHLDVLTNFVTNEGGRVVHFAGDAVLAEFSSIVAAVACALRAQQALGELNAPYPPDKRVQFRIGINIGEVLVDRGDIFGDGVNMAARHESLAEPGGICVAERVFDEVDGKVDCRFQFLGERRVKQHERPIRPYRVLPGPGEQAVPAARNARRLMQPALVIGVFALLLATAHFYQKARQSPDLVPGPAATAGPRELVSIAVLPFQNMSDDPDQEYFSDGFTEDLITDLSKVPGLLVIARSSSFSFKGRGIDVREVGKQLGASYVVEGSVRRAAGTMRINAQLIDTRTGHHVWAERYDGPKANVFTLQDRIGRQITDALALRLGDESPASGVEVAETADMAAYELYLRGRSLFEEFSRSTTIEARSFFEAAIARDANFAAALAMIAWTHVFEYTNGWREDSDVALETALRLANEAISIRPDLPVAYFVRGLVHRERKAYVQALAEAQKAIEIDPNYANGHVLLATLFYYAGRPEEGLAVVRKAQRLHPYHPSNYPFHEGQALFILKRYDEALDAFKRGIKQNNTSQRLRVWLAATYAQMGRQEDAEWEADMVLQSDPDFSLRTLPQAFPFTDPAELDHIMTALRKAGFEEEIHVH